MKKILVADVPQMDVRYTTDLLRIVRADAAHARVPVVCVRGRPGFTAVSSLSLEIAVKALGADEFIELPAGENGDGALRAAVERLISCG